MIHQIKYTLTFTDFQHIMKAKQTHRKLTGWKRILLRTALLLLFLLLISNKYEALLAGPLAISIVLGVTQLLLALALVIGFELVLDHVLPWLIFNRQKSEIRAVELSFKQDRLDWSNPRGAGYLYWSSFKLPVDQSDAMVLFINSMQAFIVPRHAFTSDQDFEDTCCFISARIKASRESKQGLK